MGTNGKIIIVPKATTVSIVLNALKPISHHDPSLTDASNNRLFNRRPMLAKIEPGSLNGAKEAIETIYGLSPVPPDMAVMFEQFSISEFVGAAFASTFVDAHNTGEGMGHFDNTKKFPALQHRLKQAAVKSFTLSQCWDALCEAMGVGVADGVHLPRILALFKIPRALAYTALGEMVKNSTSYATIAQYWHDQWKLATRGESYAASRGQGMSQLVAIKPAKANFTTGAVIRLDIPAISENSLRHQLRQAAYQHLFAILDIERDDRPGWAELPEMVESLFVNGGNIEQGAKSPANPNALAAQIRTAYRSVDLFSGTTRSFWLGTGKLTGLRNWFICRENRSALPAVVRDDPLTAVSVFDMLDNITETRRATERGSGQMIQNFETVITGAKLYAEFDLDRYINPLTLGAFQAALDTYLGDCPELGGQSARGYGFMNGEILQPLPNGAELRAQYEMALLENQDALRQALIDGTMMTGQVVM